MARGRQRGRPPTDQAGQARAALVEAAAAVLHESGFVGASARTIAARAGVNSALVFYYFGSVNDLILAALDSSSSARLTKYRDATEGVDDLATLLRVVTELNVEDHAAGHIAIVAAMVGGASSIPGLGPQVAERLRPWHDLAAEIVQRLATRYGLIDLVDCDAVATGVVSLFLGVELLSQLEDDRAASDALFAQGERLMQFAAPLLTLAERR